MSISRYITECHEIAKSKGWWEQPRTFGDQLALIHSELSEALEEFRKITDEPGTPGLADTYFYMAQPNKPEGVPSELADVLIRIFDTCGYYGIDLENALEAKIAYNRTRSYRHGGKAL